MDAGKDGVMQSFWGFTDQFSCNAFGVEVNNLKTAVY